MAIKYRQELGRPLTYAEGDENFRTLAESIEKTLAEYPTLADAMADDIPDGVVFLVNDGDDAGYWRRDSSDPEGAVFLRPLPENDQITPMLLNEQYGVLSSERNIDGVVTSAEILWQDGTSGTATMEHYNEEFITFDGYSITYNGDPVKTLVQPKVTRDIDGNITNKPNKEII